MHIQNRCVSIIFIATILLASCSKEPAEGPAPPSADVKAIPVVYTVNYPLKYFAERIGGEHVEVVFPAPADEDPAYWMPGAEAIVGFQEADLILLNGATYAKWLDKVTLPEGKFLNTSKGFEDRYIPIEGAITHSHGPEGEHEHTGTAFTTWLDFSLAKAHAEAIRDAFTELKPEKKDIFQKNLDGLARDLDGLDQRMKEIVAENKDRPLVGSHPVYQYLAKGYGLNVRSVHWEPDEAPDAVMWKEFGDLLSGHPAKWMIWEGEPMENVMRRLKEMGVSCLVFDPCGNAPKEGDFLTVMSRNLEKLKAAF